MVVHQPVAIVELYAGSRGIPGRSSSFVVKKRIKLAAQAPLGPRLKV